MKASPLIQTKTGIVTSIGQYWSSDSSIAFKGIIIRTTSGNSDNAFGIKKVDFTTVTDSGDRNASTSGSTGWYEWLEAHKANPTNYNARSTITIRAYYTTTAIQYIPT